MAVTGFAESLLGGLPTDLKRVLTELVRYVLPNGRFGPVEHQTKLESFNAFYIMSTTATSTSEFSVVHGLGRTPYLAIPALTLESSNHMLPVLRCSRPADGQRAYFKAEAGSTNARFTLIVE